MDYMMYRFTPVLQRVARSTGNIVGRLIGEERGQAVAEYALVLLVVAAIAGTFLIWAKTTGKVSYKL